MQTFAHRILHILELLPGSKILRQAQLHIPSKHLFGLNVEIGLEIRLQLRLVQS